MRTKVGFLLVAVASLLVCGVSAWASEWPPDGVTMNRRVIDLDGTWDVSQGSMEAVPEWFGHTVPVPGLLDMAEPAFEEVGKQSERREAFWYRTFFPVHGAVPPTAVLKIGKAKYGTKVWLNGKVVGEHLPCFTPALLDVTEHLKGFGHQNELIVRVGADRESRPTDVPSGWDFEKYKYIPGIYDSVELILAGEPYIRNVQTVPDIEGQTVRVVAELVSSQGGSCNIAYEVSEAGSGKVVATAERSDVPLSAEGLTRLDIVIPLESCRLWSPEDPFLYRLKLETEGDEVATRFGMRSFRFDRETGRAVLNGEPYIMRGTNVCIYRFFEDDARGDKPWREDWVRKLHRKFKGMHWNSIRYCIGFPPESWYEIADEEGFLIQDEFPIWLLGEAPEDPQAEKIVPEYTAWMRERWNHPCAVIWDAQNESVTEETGKALEQVRHLDLSGRPWENGWAEPQSPQDCVESHPYVFISLHNPSWGPGDFSGLADMAGMSGVPRLRDAQKKLDVPIIINEYAWLWLNRDGTTTSLTENVYGNLLGPNSTTEERRLLYAKNLAALTEFWRGHRQCAGVLHFCGLGYSRAGDKPRPEGGATSDHFIDLETLTFEPLFVEYVRDAFAPVGLMLDYWTQDLPAGTEREMEVYVVNDRNDEAEGKLRLRLMKDGKVVAMENRTIEVDALGREIVPFTQYVPAAPGEYMLIAELKVEGQDAIRSVRDMNVVAGK